MINKTYFEKFPELETSRLLLRQLKEEDAAGIFKIRSRPKSMQYMDSQSHKDVEDSRRFIKGNLERYDLQKGLFWAIVLKEDQEFLGDVTFWRIDHKNSRAEVGYTLSPEYWGKGFMTEALGAVIHFGFNHLGLHSIEANINPQNEASRKLLLKIGFRKEAYFRENYYFDGRYLDSEIYSLLKSDLPGREK